MKRKAYKLIISSMIVTGMLFAGSVAGFALTVAGNAADNPTVTLSPKNSGGVEFTFNRPDTDLFDNFKDVVPGDELSQTIVVKHDAQNISGGSDFNIYLYAENSDKERIGGGDAVPDDLFEKIKLTVTKDGNALELKKTGNDSKGVSLGKFSYGDAQNLSVKLSVPIELGNEYQNCKGKVNWYFYAEQVADEIIDDPDTPLNPPPFETIEDNKVPLNSLPKTGDNSNIFIFAIVAGCCVVAIVALNVVRIKTRRKSVN